MAGGAGGFRAPDPYAYDTPPKPIAPPAGPTSSFGNPSTFTAAANTQASDYDTIMQGYKDVLAKQAQNPLFFSPVKPTTSNYQQSGDVTSSLANLKDLSITGGYSPQGIADLRARGIAPTRSIYANAQQNMERQKALAGGYSPNFNAAQAQLARDESDKIAGINTDVNAGIAQNVATNRIAAATPYASASSTANAAQTASDARNADIFNTVGMFNADGTLRSQMFNRGNQTAALQGMTSLYGTTPALTSTFGNQVTNAAQLGQGQQVINQQKNNALLGGVLGGSMRT